MEGKPAADQSAVESHRAPQRTVIGAPLQGQGKSQEHQPHQQADGFEAGKLIPGMHQGKEGGLQPDRPLPPPEQLQLTPEPTPEEQFLGKAHPQQQGDGIQEFSCGDLSLPVALTTEQKDDHHAKEQSGRFQQAPQESAQAGRRRQDNPKRSPGMLDAPALA